MAYAFIHSLILGGAGGASYFFTCVGICKEQKHGQSAQKVPERPVKVANVVGNPTRKRQSKEGVRQGQVKQIDGGGIRLLLPLAHYIEDQTVATQADDENSSIENGEEHHRSALVNKHVTRALVVSRGQSDVTSCHHHLGTQWKNAMKQTKMMA